MVLLLLGRIVVPLVLGELVMNLKDCDVEGAVDSTMGWDTPPDMLPPEMITFVTICCTQINKKHEISASF